MLIGSSVGNIGWAVDKSIQILDRALFAGLFLISCLYDTSTEKFRFLFNSKSKLDLILYRF